MLTRRTVPPIVRDGSDVVVSTWYGLQGEPQTWRVQRGDEQIPVAVLPSVDPTTYGVDTLLASYERHQCDALIACMDVWVLNPQITARTRFCPWLPVDHDPAPAGVVNACGPAVYPMVYSRWGVDVLARAGIEAHYVPCSAPAGVFTPLDKADAKKQLSLPDGCEFLVAMIAANKDPDDRKGWAEGLQAFAKFLASHPSAYLIAHTNWTGALSIAAICERLGITEHVLRPDPYAYLLGLYPESYMRLVYSAADVLMNPAKSEGFGLPIVEAQMCGTPVIATDFSTSRELVSAGWLVDGQMHWTTGADTWRMTVSVDKLADALGDAYANRGNEVLQQQARKGAREYDTELVHERYWRSALRDIEEIVSGKGGSLELVQF